MADKIGQSLQVSLTAVRHTPSCARRTAALVGPCSLPTPNRPDSNLHSGTLLCRFFKMPRGA